MLVQKEEQELINQIQITKEELVKKVNLLKRKGFLVNYVNRIENNEVILKIEITKVTKYSNSL